MYVFIAVLYCFLSFRLDFDAFACKFTIVARGVCVCVHVYVSCIVQSLHSDRISMDSAIDFNVRG